MQRKYDVIVIGAGLAGLVCAREAAERHSQVLVIEKNEHVGGLCSDYSDEHGINIHRFGPHIFHTEDNKIWEYLGRYTEWFCYRHRVLAVINNKFVPLPFNLESIRMLFPPENAEKLEETLKREYRYGSRISISELSKNPCLEVKDLSRFIIDNVFRNYSKKQWGTELDNLKKEVTDRVPVSISHDNLYFNDEFQAVPSEGYSNLFENILSHANIDVRLNADCCEFISLRDGEILFKGETFNGKIIYTGPIDELFKYEFGELEYRSCRIEHHKLDEEAFQPVAVVNYPNDHDFTRITEFKHFQERNENLGKTCICYEYPTEYRRLENLPLYPVNNNRTAKIYSQYRKKADQYHNLYLVGRLAQYRYFDMDEVVSEALALCSEVFI